jgi:hypothetical protein
VFATRAGSPARKPARSRPEVGTSACGGARYRLPHPWVGGGWWGTTPVVEPPLRAWMGAVVDLAQPPAVDM